MNKDIKKIEKDNIQSRIEKILDEMKYEERRFYTSSEIKEIVSEVTARLVIEELMKMDFDGGDFQTKTN